VAPTVLSVLVTFSDIFLRLISYTCPPVLLFVRIETRRSEVSDSNTALIFTGDNSGR